MASNAEMDLSTLLTPSIIRFIFPLWRQERVLAHAHNFIIQPKDYAYLKTPN